jgi:hypothetical protein
MGGSSVATTGRECGRFRDLRATGIRFCGFLSLR